MGRVANVDEYQSTIVYLVSEASSYMTGAVLTVDGDELVGNKYVII